MKNVKPITVLLVVGVVTVVLTVFVLLGFSDGNFTLFTSQSCRAGMQNISCTGSIGELHGSSRLDLYDEGTSVSWRGSNWNADITMSIEEGELLMEITNLNNDVERFTITPDNPLQVRVAVDRSIMGTISAQLHAQATNDDAPVVRGIQWEANFTAR